MVKPIALNKLVTPKIKLRNNPIAKPSVIVPIITGRHINVKLNTGSTGFGINPTGVSPNKKVSAASKAAIANFLVFVFLMLTSTQVPARRIPVFDNNIWFSRHVALRLHAPAAKPETHYINNSNESQ